MWHPWRVWRQTITNKSNHFACLICRVGASIGWDTNQLTIPRGHKWANTFVLFKIKAENSVVNWVNLWDIYPLKLDVLFNFLKTTRLIFILLVKCLEQSMYNNWALVIIREQIHTSRPEKVLRLIMSYSVFEFWLWGIHLQHGIVELVFTMNIFPTAFPNSITAWRQHVSVSGKIIHK